MQYKVIKQFRGSPDGARVLEYAEGQIVSVNTDFSADLRDAMLEEGNVEPFEEKKAPAKKAAKKKAK